MEELEIQEKELSVQLKLKELEKTSTAPPKSADAMSLAFDVSKHIKFVPPFQEKEVDKYFLHFEKIATSLEWPQDTWMLLLQSVLVGKAREVYSAMSVEQSSQYDLVKKAVLKAYELVPEAYRQNFRNSRKQDKQTYTEFARDKEALFDRWCSSKEVAQNFEKLRQLVLVEEFKSCLPINIKTYVDEQKADNLQQAATLADDYSLTHRSSFAGSHSESSNRGGLRSSDPIRNTHPVARGQQRSISGGPICSYCKRRGHVISECWSLEKKKANATSNAVVRTVNPTSSAQPVVQSKDCTKKPCKGSYFPFISEGRVSLTEDGETVTVKILRDTGATQTLLAGGILPLSEQTSTGTSMLIQGVELGVISVPLHRVYLRSELVSGPVIVGIRPTLPIQGISLILGNDLAGGKVTPEPQVINNTTELLNLAPVKDGPTETFPACVVTRAAA